MLIFKGIIDKVASLKLAVTAAGTVDITMPVSILAAAYITGQALVDAFGQ